MKSVELNMYEDLSANGDSWCSQALVNSIKVYCSKQIIENLRTALFWPKLVILR